MRRPLATIAPIALSFILSLAACRSTQEPSQTTPAATPAPAAAPPVAQAAATAKPGDPPETILFTSKYGDVLYTHKKHYDRLNGDCSVCHTKLFPQALAPLNYKKALHRVAEGNRSSCASCHAVGGSSFAADSNCIRCHAQKDYSAH